MSGMSVFWFVVRGFSLAVVFTSFQLCFANDDDDDGQITLYLQHSFESDPVPQFISRGTITIDVKSGETSVFQDTLKTSDILKLKKLTQEGGIYRLKVSTKEDDQNETSLLTFMNACSLYESGLSDIITVTLDASGNLLGMAAMSFPSLCTGSLVTDSKIVNFNTSVYVTSTVTGPVPDTQTYIQRLEQEKAEKARGEQADNRSFFAKYWMYIVPLVIFLLISGASSPENQGGGR